MAVHFSARVGPGTFHLQTDITLLGGPPRPSGRVPKTNYPEA